MSASRFEDRETQALMGDGYAALRENRIDDALAIAAELRRRRHSSNFEIEARARWARGEREAAVAVLEEGVNIAPKATPLWHWLGCYRSDLGRYEPALEAFTREAEFESVSPSTNAYNVAVVYERMDRPADALDLLDRIERPEPPGPSPAHFAELRARLLFDLGRFNDAIEASTQAVDRFGEQAEVHEGGSDDEEEQPEPLEWDVLARAYAVRADARLALGDPVGAVEDATACIDLGPPHAPARALDVLRRAEGKTSSSSHRYVLLLEGEMPGDEEGERRGFFVSMHVVAGSAAEGLEYARRFVPDAARPGLSLAEADDKGAAPGELPGVYWCGLLHTFDPDAPQDDEENDDA